MAAPTNYEQMVWDKGRHFYIPTKNGFEKELATNLELQTHMFDGSAGDITSEINAWCKEISDAIRQWIKRETPIDNHAYIEYQFAYDVSCQQHLWIAFLDMARYDIRSGGLLLRSQHGVNIERGKTIDVEELRGRLLVASGAVDELKATGLITSVSFPYTIDPSIYRIEY